MLATEKLYNYQLCPILQIFNKEAKRILLEFLEEIHVLAPETILVLNKSWKR